MKIMKSFGLFALALMMGSLNSHAEVQVSGSVSKTLCGSTTAFPFSSSICLAVVQDSPSKYLAVAQNRNSHVLPGGGVSGPTKYFLITKAKKRGNVSKYTAVGVGEQESRRPMEVKYELTVRKDDAGLFHGSLKLNGQHFLGSEDFQMEYQVQTEGVQ